MKKVLYYLLPIVIFGIVMGVVVPITTSYEKKLNAICLQGNHLGQVSSLKPTGQAVVTLDIERMKYLLREPDAVKGKIILSRYESLPHDAEGIEYVTGSWGELSAVQEQESENTKAEPMFYAKFSNWDEEKKRGNNYQAIQVVYNADLSRMLIKDEKYWKIYFCSEDEADLDELLAYFEDECEINLWLQQNGKK